MHREWHAEILIVGASFGGVSAALAAARAGRRVVLTEETGWIGGQATAQGVPLDEHPWIERYGSSESYRQFRRNVREYYRRNYPLTEQSRADRAFNPGAGWVSALCFEPKAGRAVLEELLAPYLSAGRILLVLHHRPVAVQADGDLIRAVTLQSTRGGDLLTVAADYVLDATELGELLELGKIEHVIGAEAHDETAEPTALEQADPLRQQGFTHLIAVDYRPGEDHTIERPPDYDRFRDGFASLVGMSDDPALKQRRLFGAGMADPTRSAGSLGTAEDRETRAGGVGRGAAAPSQPYQFCIWNFRRVLCAANFLPGTIDSDVTMLMSGNEYRGGVLCGVPAPDAAANREAARRMSLALVHFLQTEVEPGYGGGRGFPGIRPRPDVFDTADGLAVQPYIRESRRIRAEYTVTERSFHREQPGREEAPERFADAVAVGGYRIDVHEPHPAGQSYTLSLHGKHWPQQLPLGALLPVRIDNLLPACKNIGATHVTNGCFRLHPNEWSTGEAAGHLAAFCLDHGVRPRAVRADPRLVAALQRRLERDGMELEWPQWQPAMSYHSYRVDQPAWYWGESARAPRLR